MITVSDSNVHQQVKPNQHSSESKKHQVAAMFNKIAFKYDFLNHILSLNIDKIWRRKVVARVGKHHAGKILDVATGTADLAIALSKLKPSLIQGIDISDGMLKVGKDKVTARNLDHLIQLMVADAESIPFNDNSFDALTVAFGVRNFEDLSAGLKEMHRVLKPGGLCVVLEFTMPVVFPVKQLYKFYFRFILPVIGRMFSKDQSAYTYLPQSVEAFPQRNIFVQKLQEAGFSDCNYQSLSFGIASIYTGVK